ncbi:DNA-binding protein [Alsobacter soli]|uniref:DNA-binding protein n=1 Tax=Alsobacter soli TaxID=2109933 RepID=A0A2T1HVI8_9HYPH|nr:HPF/RaiA family ribosome-associated protein [Alsobacter soli]PSC05610.1 DNA-binding protein [Alsobacter soli]
MQTPVEIDFQGMEPVDFVHEEVVEHVQKLEKRYGRITACRVAVKKPSGHHQTGGLYEINIWLSLPEGREVAVVKTPQLDERHSHLIFALGDAFKRAERRLQDHVRKLQRQVKVHEDAPVGTVTQLSPDAEFGFLTTADGREIYFHRNSVLHGQYPRLKVGSRVSFAEEMGDKGPQASTVRPLGRHGMRL